MARCSVCNKMIVGGYRDGEERFCSLVCFTASPTGGFCEACMLATTSESPGGTFTFNTFGTTMAFARDRCRTCHSVVQAKAICAFLIPLIPLSRYRVFYVAYNRYVGRRLRG